MTARELTRRSLLVAAGAAAGGLLRSRAALARAVAAGASSGRAAGTAGGSGMAGRSSDRPSDPAARTRASARGGALELATPVLPAGGGQPPIIAREVWARGDCKPRVAPEYGSVRLAFVHHTENPNGYAPSEVPAMLRAIFRFHRDSNGWNDIGYNFVLDRFGRIWEARAGGIDQPVSGAQAGGYNYCSTGIAVLGEYGATRISPAARAALVRLLAWKLALHGTPISGHVVVRVNPAGAVYSRYPADARVLLPRVAGHRQADSTDCPGNALYRELPGVRLSAARVQGTPARLTLLQQAAAVTPAAETPPAQTAPAAPPTPPPAPTPAATLSGTLAFLSAGAGGPGVPIAGAPIAIQLRSVSRRGETVRELTIAQAQTAADGSWSVPLYTPASGVAAQPAGATLRAVCPGATGVPAAVSEALRLAGAFSFTAPAQSAG